MIRTGESLKREDSRVRQLSRRREGLRRLRELVEKLEERAVLARGGSLVLREDEGRVVERVSEYDVHLDARTLG